MCSHSAKAVQLRSASAYEVPHRVLWEQRGILFTQSASRAAAQRGRGMDLLWGFGDSAPALAHLNNDAATGTDRALFAVYTDLRHGELRARGGCRLCRCLCLCRRLRSHRCAAAQPQAPASRSPLNSPASPSAATSAAVTAAATLPFSARPAASSSLISLPATTSRSKGAAAAMMPHHDTASSCRHVLSRTPRSTRPRPHRQVGCETKPGVKCEFYQVVLNRG